MSGAAAVSSDPFSTFQIPHLPATLGPEPLWMMDSSSISSNSSDPPTTSTALTPASDGDFWMSEFVANPFLFTEKNTRQLDDLDFLVGWDSQGLSEAQPDIHSILGDYSIPII